MHYDRTFRLSHIGLRELAPRAENTEGVRIVCLKLTLIIAREEICKTSINSQLSVRLSNLLKYIKEKEYDFAMRLCVQNRVDGVHFKYKLYIRSKNWYYQGKTNTWALGVNDGVKVYQLSKSSRHNYPLEHNALTQMLKDLSS
eukprot:SM000103S09483  [mRNA]  locus=s103:135306:136050:- [translate_table: standard]